MPIRLILNRVSLGPNATQVIETSRPVRTKPKLFENVLGLFPGTPFEFRIDRWRALQSCGLFGNLTARSFSDENGVALLITGVERPSITFQPEASVGLSLTNPDINGGLVWRDSNFRGLGETMEILISKKEGLEEGTDQLQPYVRAKWNANSIGRSSSVAVAVESSEEIVNIANYLSPSKLSGLQTHFSNFIHNLRKPIQSTSIIVTMQQQLQNSPFVWGIEPYFRSFSQQPKIDSSASDFAIIEKSIISGTKFFCQTVFMEKMRMSAWWDRGSSMQKGDFSHSGMTLDFPSFKLPFFRSSPRIRKAVDVDDKSGKNGVRSSTTTGKSVITKNSKNEASYNTESIAQQQQDNDDDSMTVVCQLHATQAWGLGKLPFLHHISGEKSSWFRGFPILQAKDRNHVIERMACIKTDLILPWPKTVQLGLFVDAGLISSDQTEKPNEGSVAEKQRKNTRVFDNFSGLTTSAMFTSGVSLRFRGFKVEVGSPVLQPSRARLYFGVDALSL